MADIGDAAVQRILEERARNMARRTAGTAGDGDRMTVLRFHVGESRFGVETRHVLETCRMDGLAQLPMTPRFVHGVLVLRGRILAVVDLAVILGLPVPDPSPADQVVVLRGGHMEFGVRANTIDGVADVPPPASDASMPAFAGRMAHLFLGISGDDLAILDGGRLLAADELRVSGPSARRVPAAPVEG